MIGTGTGPSYERHGKPPTAEEVRWMLGQASARAGWRAAGGLLSRSGRGGPALGLALGDKVEVLLSGTSSPYSWSERNGPRSGTANCVEVNDVAQLGGKVAHAVVSVDDLRFQWVTSGTGAGETWLINTPGCPCPVVPSPLAMTVAGCPGGIFYPATLAYGPTPAEFASLSLGGSCFLSTTSFIDSLTGDSFRYYFFCEPGLFALTRVYSTSIYGYPVRDGVRYRWPVPWAGNSCYSAGPPKVSFALTYGESFGEGSSPCTVTITGG